MLRLSQIIVFKLDWLCLKLVLLIVELRAQPVHSVLFGYGQWQFGADDALVQ